MRPKLQNLQKERLFTVFLTVLDNWSDITTEYLHPLMLAKCRTLSILGVLRSTAQRRAFIGAVKPHAYGKAINKHRADVPRATRITERRLPCEDFIYQGTKITLPWGNWRGRFLQNYDSRLVTSRRRKEPLLNNTQIVAVHGGTGVYVFLEGR